MLKIKGVMLFLLFLIVGIAEADVPSSQITLSTTGSYTITGVYLQALYTGGATPSGACSGTVVFNNPLSANKTYGAMWGEFSMNNSSRLIYGTFL